MSHTYGRLNTLVGCSSTRVECFYDADGRGPTHFHYFLDVNAVEYTVLVDDCAAILGAGAEYCRTLVRRPDDPTYVAFLEADDCDYVLRDVKSLARAILKDDCPRPCPGEDVDDRVECFWDDPDADEPSHFHYAHDDYTIQVVDCPEPSTECSIGAVHGADDESVHKDDCASLLETLASLAHQLRPRACPAKAKAPRHTQSAIVAPDGDPAESKPRRRSKLKVVAV